MWTETTQQQYRRDGLRYASDLQIYFSVAHNPTELNRQGPDVGSQYRSAIFPTNPEQMRIAEAYIV
jgi:peptide-methionine (S)-S-oxide reductase